jgi:hypothetical protein
MAKPIRVEMKDGMLVVHCPCGTVHKHKVPKANSGKLLPCPNCHPDVKETDRHPGV